MQFVRLMKRQKHFILSISCDEMKCPQALKSAYVQKEKYYSEIKARQSLLNLGHAMDRLKDVVDQKEESNKK